MVAKWSVKDYHQMIEAGILQDRELLGGEISEMSPEGAPHYMLGEDVAAYLRTLLIMQRTKLENIGSSICRNRTHLNRRSQVS